MLNSQTYPRRAPTEIYWAEMESNEHSVQIYADQELFIDVLEGFVSGGLRAGESIIVIATAAHRRALQSRLRTRGFDVGQAISEDRYIAVDAEAALSQIIVDGWPNGERFNKVVGELVSRARGNGRRVRAFGEMVAILWVQGHTGATMRLEQMWNSLIETESFALFCAYSRSGFTSPSDKSILEICSHHSRLIPE